MEVIIKYFVSFLIASFIVLSLFWGLSKLTLEYELEPDYSAIIDDSNMTIPRMIKATDLCDCYYIAREGGYKQVSQGTGCNIVHIKGIDRHKIPECTAEVVK